MDAVAKILEQHGANFSIMHSESGRVKRQVFDIHACDEKALGALLKDIPTDIIISSVVPVNLEVYRVTFC